MLILFLLSFFSPYVLASDSIQYGPYRPNSSEFQIYNTKSVHNQKVRPLHIVVVKSSQRMWIFENKVTKINWPVSTGVEGVKCAPTGECYVASTPEGWFSVDSAVPLFHSTVWKADLSYAILFNGVYAIHASGNLTPWSSGGCIRISRENAKALYEMVLFYGIENTSIDVRP